MPNRMPTQPGNPPGVPQGTPTDIPPGNHITRRQFLQGAWILAAGGVLAACGVAPEEIGMQATYWRTPTPANVLQSPVPPAETATPAPGDLGAFLALSSILTGVDNLDPQLGQAYLGSLNGSSEFAGQFPTLLDRAGFQSSAPPATLEDLSAAGIFDQEESRTLADKIIEIWYTGTIEQEGEQVVLTYVDALAWKVLHFTKPPTICGYYGIWAEDPSEHA